MSESGSAEDSSAARPSIASRTRTLTSGSVGQHLSALTIPMFLGISSLILASVIDTVFVGWLGTSELAVISFAFPFMMVVMSLTMGLGVGVTSIMSRTLGGGDREKSLTIGTHTLILATVVSITVGIAGFASASSLFAIQGAESDVLAMTVAYAQIWLLGLPFFAIPMMGGMMLRALGDVRSPAIIMVVGSVLQVALAPILIFGVGSWDGFGVYGSAWAFTLSRFATFLYSVHVFGAHGLFRNPESWKSTVRSWGQVLHLAVPTMASNLASPVSMGVLVWMVSAYGVVFVAAFGVALRIEALALMVLMALSSSIGPIVGQNFGAKQYARINRALRLSYRFSIAWGVLACVILIAAGSPLLWFIVDDGGVVDAAYTYLLIVPVTYGLLGISMVASSAFIALGKPLPSLVLGLTRSLLFLVPLAWVLGEVWGYSGICIALSVNFVVTGFISALWLRWWLNSERRRALGTEREDSMHSEDSSFEGSSKKQPQVGTTL